MESESDLSKPRKPDLILRLFKCFVTCLKRDALYKPSAFVSVLFILLKYTCHYAQLNGGIYFNMSRTSLGEGSGTPLQYFSLENPMDGGAW